ncbi:hypothetical protein PENTCL1PPCAC_3240 [Pristionchus entomophagus]|uniref:Uncharacterized protein n=1 Tax=Pristionchus entomophagus TaxID=358040 RepID=A0AAV5SDS5_9BILA|nr:hypothetical protein PENTCL1PPCAC_3240 [Pristionchus entomophagus]
MERRNWVSRSSFGFCNQSILQRRFLLRARLIHDISQSRKPHLQSRHTNIWTKFVVEIRFHNEKKSRSAHRNSEKTTEIGQCD